MRWTQRAADRRAEREAVLRLDNDLKMHKCNQRRAAYEQILVALRPILAGGDFPDDTMTMALITQTDAFSLYCSDEVQAALDELAEAIMELHAQPDDAELDSRDDILQKGIDLSTLMRKELL